MKFVTAKRIMEDAQLGETAAYNLMHMLGAVRFGRAVRLPEHIWLKYTAALCRQNGLTGRPVGIMAMLPVEDERRRIPRELPSETTRATRPRFDEPYPGEPPERVRLREKWAKINEKAKRPSEPPPPPRKR